MPLLAPSSVFRLHFSRLVAAHRLKRNLYAHCLVSWKQLTTALGYACVSKVPECFRNLQLVHDS